MFKHICTQFYSSERSQHILSKTHTYICMIFPNKEEAYRPCEVEKVGLGPESEDADVAKDQTQEAGKDHGKRGGKEYNHTGPSTSCPARRVQTKASDTMGRKRDQRTFIHCHCHLLLFHRFIESCSSPSSSLLIVSFSSFPRSLPHFRSLIPFPPPPPPQACWPWERTMPWRWEML